MQTLCTNQFESEERFGTHNRLIRYCFCLAQLVFKLLNPTRQEISHCIEFVAGARVALNRFLNYGQVFSSVLKLVFESA